MAVITRQCAGCCIQSDTQCSLAQLSSTLSDGYHFLLPSFFRLLAQLREQRREFAVCFRTFGVDIPEVAAEMNLFCAGQHPCYPNARFDGRSMRKADSEHLAAGTNGTPDLRLRLPDSSVVLHRSFEEICWLHGTTEPVCLIFIRPLNQLD